MDRGSLFTRLQLSLLIFLWTIVQNPSDRQDSTFLPFHQLLTLDFFKQSALRLIVLLGLGALQ